MFNYRIFFAHPDRKLVGIYQPCLSKHFLLDSAHDGLTALRKIKIHKPNLILSSYELPLISGLSLLKFIRGDRDFLSTPFIFLSDEISPYHALNFAANDWIEKRQATPDLVIERIYYHLKQNHGLQIH